jgi:predicted ArsR family transcriptional regulator
MLENLRPRQREILSILLNERFPVTTDYLQTVMGYADNTGVRPHLKVLESMGYIQPRRKYEHRSIVLSEAGRAALAAKEAA